MEKIYCQFCGKLLSKGCKCEKEYLIELSEQKDQFIEDYENRLDVQYGWYQQDLIDIRKREQ